MNTEQKKRVQAFLDEGFAYIVENNAVAGFTLDELKESQESLDNANSIPLGGNNNA